jgi:hypothetical protein
MQLALRDPPGIYQQTPEILAGALLEPHEFLQCGFVQTPIGEHELPEQQPRLVGGAGDDASILEVDSTHRHAAGDAQHSRLLGALQPLKQVSLFHDLERRFEIVHPRSSNF